MGKPSKVNIVADSSPRLAYQNDCGELWVGPYDTTMHNVVDREKARKPDEESLLILEPYCVDPLDYDLETSQRFKHVFTWNPLYFSLNGLEKNITKINLPSSCHPINADLLYSKTTPWKKRNNEVVFIANNKYSQHPSQTYSLRRELATFFHSTNTFRVSWYGYDKFPKAYYKGRAFSKHNVLRNTKFVVCIENCYDPVFSQNYFTEKFPEVISSGAVPLYMGCFNIDEFGFDPYSYVDLRGFVTKDGHKHHIKGDELLRALFLFDKYEEFKQGMKYNIRKENGLNHITSYFRMYDTILRTVAGNE